MTPLGPIVGPPLPPMGRLRPMIDAHLDLAWNALQWNRDLTRPLDEVRAAEAHMTDSRARGHGTVSLPELGRAGVFVCLGTLLARSKPEVAPAKGFDRRDIDFGAPSIAGAMAAGQLHYYESLARAGVARLIGSADELETHWAEWSADPTGRPPGIILAMEGADPIADPRDAADWFARGVRCVGLTHYGKSPYGVGTGESGPLTFAGRALLAEFERLGMILDLTHAADATFCEALDRFDGAVLASHSTCRALVPGDRQLADEQLRRLIERDAVIGMPLDAWMLHAGFAIDATPRDAVSISAVADHIDHVCQLAGDCRHVGIGSDLDGGYGSEQCPRELGSIFDLHALESILARRGYSPVDVDAIFYGNWLRFFADALPAANPAGERFAR